VVNTTQEYLYVWLTEERRKCFILTSSAREKKIIWLWELWKHGNLVS